MDKYDKAIEYLTEHPEKIEYAWSCGGSTDIPGAALFDFCAPADRSSTPEGNLCGCLTMIRRDKNMHAWTPALTDEIRADDRIPKHSANITDEHFTVFAEWQRRLDKEIRQPQHA